MKNGRYFNFRDICDRKLWDTGYFGQKITGIHDIKTPYTNGASQMKTALCKVNFMNNLCGKHAQLLPNHQKTSDWSLPSRSVIHSDPEVARSLTDKIQWKIRIGVILMKKKDSSV